MEDIELSPEVATALKIMQENMPPIEIFNDVAKSIPQEVPDATDNSGWKHGSCRIMGMIGGYSSWHLEIGMIMTTEDLDLTKIEYVAIYRQAVKNKKGDVKFFYVTVPLGTPKSAHPGETFEVKEKIPYDWDRNILEQQSRNAFIQLQVMVKEYAESEA